MSVLSTCLNNVLVEPLSSAVSISHSETSSSGKQTSAWKEHLTWALQGMHKE